MAKEWVKGDASDWVLLPVERDKAKPKSTKARGGMQRAYQIFTNWAYAGHSRGGPIFPDGLVPDWVFWLEEGDDGSGDVAIAEAALLAFARFAGHKAHLNTRSALIRRHLDGKELSGQDVLNAERVYRLAVNIERGK